MNIENILKTVDHTILAQTSTWADIQKICDEGIKYKVASVCIPSAYVKQAKDYAGKSLKICTVIGFPNGYSTTNSKVFEAQDAIKNGADEIDMVINIGFLKEKKYNEIQDEITQIKNSIGDKILKVIIETCLLTNNEKIKLCEIVTKSNADFIKTSTGFSTGGATPHDIELFSKHVGKNVKIKAAGGISTLDDAINFINLGASRLGTSKIIKLINNENSSAY